MNLAYLNSFAFTLTSSGHSMRTTRNTITRSNKRFLRLFLHFIIAFKIFNFFRISFHRFPGFPGFGFHRFRADFQISRISWYRFLFSLCFPDVQFSRQISPISATSPVSRQIPQISRRHFQLSLSFPGRRLSRQFSRISRTFRSHFLLSHPPTILSWSNFQGVFAISQLKKGRFSIFSW